MRMFLALGRLTTRRHTLLLETVDYTEDSNINKECLDWRVGGNRLLKWGGLAVA